MGFGNRDLSEKLPVLGTSPTRASCELRPVSQVVCKENACVIALPRITYCRGYMAADPMSVVFLLRRPLVFLSVFAALACRPVTGTISATSSYIRPDYRDHAKMARWLVAENNWGVVSTTSQHLSGVAFGNLVSYSDGPRGDSTGRLLFYLTKLDATATDVAESAGATLTVGEIQLEGGCKVVDPEDPTCAKVSISGSMAEVPEGGIDEARELLFSRHPQMQGWPKGHDFRIYELQTHAIRLLDFYGGAADVSSKDYLAAQLKQELSQHNLH